MVILLAEICRKIATSCRQLFWSATLLQTSDVH